jgi:O-antigen/teichoic acid export membrane protein
MIAHALRNKILWSTFVQYAAKIIHLFVGIVIVKMVTTELGVEEYGFFGKVTEYALFFSTIANLGIFGNVVRKMSDKPQDGHLFTNALLLRVLISSAFFGAGVIYAALVIQDPRFLLGLLFFMSSLFLDYINSVANAALQANYWMGRASLAMVLGRFAELAVVYLLIGEGYDTPIFFLAPLGASALTLLILFLFVKERIEFKWSLDLGLMKMIFWTALPFGIINIINNLYFRFLPSYFAARILTDEQFGSYSIHLSLATAAALFSSFLMFSTLPAFKQTLTEKKFKPAKELYKLNQRGLLVLGLLAIGVGSFVGPMIVRIASSPSYLMPELWFMLPMLLVISAISYFYDLVLITIFAFEKERWFLKQELIALALSLPVFGAVFFLGAGAENLVIVFLAAIVGELYIVASAQRKIRSLFAN